MKIEKISENQIRCTLNKEDLLDRQLRLSELAYGTEKAKLLFRDMMQQAAFEFGFEADDIPLMIEAIPISPESLILVVTKVEDPDELDTRFSKFSPEDTEEDEEDEEDDDTSYADEIINCFSQLDELLDENRESSKLTDDNNRTYEDSVHTASDNSNSSVGSNAKQNVYKVFSFHSLEEVIQLCARLVSFYHGENDLYKDTVNNTYYLVLNSSDHTPQEFNQVCNLVSEYGKMERSSYATLAYFKEHYEVIVKNSAVQILSVM
jgi:Negative regulator of genetic competence, sporulation and motility